MAATHLSNDRNQTQAGDQPATLQAPPLTISSRQDDYDQHDTSCLALFTGLHSHNLRGDVSEIRSDHIRPRHQRIEHFAKPRDEPGRTAGAQRACHVPRVRRYEPDVSNRDAETLRCHPIGFGRWLKALDRIHRQDLLEIRGQARMVELGPRNLLRRIGQRCQPKTGSTQTFKAGPNVRMRRKLSDSAQYLLAIVLAQLHAPSVSRHL